MVYFCFIIIPRHKNIPNKKSNSTAWSQKEDDKVFQYLDLVVVVLVYFYN
jgi:hypothetical protein